MPKYVTKMSKTNGQQYEVMDKGERSLIVQTKTDLEEQIEQVSTDLQAQIEDVESNLGGQIENVLDDVGNAQKDITKLNTTSKRIIDTIGDGTNGIYRTVTDAREEAYGKRIKISSDGTATVTEEGRVSPYQRIRFFAVEPGSLCKIYYTLNENNKQIGYVFVDTNNQVLENGLGNLGTSEVLTIAPENADECWVCSYGYQGGMDVITFPDDYVSGIRKFVSEATKKAWTVSKPVSPSESEYNGYRVYPNGIGSTAVITQSGADSQYNRVAVYPITAGKIYQASIHNVFSSQRGYVITDENNVVLYNGLGMNTTLESFLAPANAAKCIVVTYGMAPSLNELEYQENEDAVYSSLSSTASAHVDEKITDIKQKVKQKGVAFTFVTDTHFPRTATQSMVAMVRRVQKETGIKDVFYGGDALYAYLTSSYTDLDVMMNACEKDYRVMNRMLCEDGYFYPVKGNHDFTLATNSSLTTGKTLSNDRSYNIIMQPNNHHAIGHDSGVYYYVDNPAQKIRYVVIDQYDGPVNTEQMWGLHNGLSQEQYDWLVNTAFNVDGYGLVVFTHAPSDSTVQDYDSHLLPVHGLMAALNAKTTYSYEDAEAGISIDADFTNATSYVIANIAGHVHADRVGVSDGVLCVTTTCEAALDTSVRNTDITRHAFDVFMVDKENKYLSAVRIGYGSNRKFSYDAADIGPVS